MWMKNILATGSSNRYDKSSPNCKTYINPSRKCYGNDTPSMKI